MARAMDSRWRSPPEREPPASPPTVSYPCGSFMIKSWQRAFFAAMEIMDQNLNAILEAEE